MANQKINKKKKARKEKEKQSRKLMFFNIAIILLSIAVFITAIWAVIILVRLFWV